MQPKIKYITNRDLLAEIKRSKTTFCHFDAPEYADYDVIVTSIDGVTDLLADATLQIKQARSQKAQVTLDSDLIVFRVMSDRHLPLEENEKRRKKSSTGEWVAKTNFAPFQHYILDDGLPIEVGRSHWHGGLVTGNFSLLHGRITNRLATMFMLMVDRYSRGGSWRSYCVDETTEALTQRGWLGINEITEDDIILSYDAGQLKWSKIKSIFRNDYEGKMFHLTVTGMDALVTPHHKFVTDSGLKQVEHLLELDKIILTGNPVEDGVGQHSDAFVELIGWMVTEGSYHFAKGRNYCRMAISQNEGPYAERIRACLDKLEVRFSEHHRLAPSGKTLVSFRLTKAIAERILEVAPDKVFLMSFILSLSQHQRELLIETMIDADGHRTNTYRRYSQKNRDHVDAFLALCTLAGYRVSYKLRNIVSFGKETSIYQITIFSRPNWSVVTNIDFHGGKNNGRALIGRGKQTHQNEPTVDYHGKIWCPETEFGSFMARRNGYVYLTGNSYVDEMRCHALVQLSQVGLQFDESRGDNPFAFYTQIIKNVFRRVLNLERRSQDIRDDLLIMSGAQPSHTRQIENELEQKDDWQKAIEGHSTGTAEGTAAKEPPKRRGRPRIIR